MSSTRVLSLGTVGVSFLLGMLGAVSPSPVHAAWVDATGTQFQVGGAFQFLVNGQVTTTLVPTIVGSTPPPGTTFVDPTCGTQGGTSLALVQGLRLKDVDPIKYPLVLVVSCLDNGGSTTTRARLNFVGVDGKVVKQLPTTAVPSTGWAHLVNRSDKGDLLGCGANGALYSIDYSRDTGTADGTATQLTPVPSAATSCKGLAWDAEADMIYLGLSVGGGSNIGQVISFQQGTSTVVGNFTGLPCAANGLTISGGTLLMSCAGGQTILRLDKNTGISLGANGVITATGLTAFQGPEPGLGDLACDPVTFAKDAAGKDQFTDTLWSRRGNNGNGVVALEFPSYTCGLPSASVTVDSSGVPFSPLAAGLSKKDTAGKPGAVPRPECFLNGRVIDSDGDGLPDCWETSGIDFGGDGTTDFTLCVDVNTNGDGVTPTTECADPYHKDLFAEIDYMQFHKPDPQALSQTQSMATVGVKSIREAFAAAPVTNPQDPNTPLVPPTSGIRIHFQVDEQLSHVDQVIFTPCTTTTGSVGATTVDFDAIKATNFGTSAERTGPNAQQRLNAKRLAVRYVVFGHDLAPLAGTSPPGVGSSGCAELGGDDAVITLGSFSGSGTIAGHTGGVGSTGEQAGTLMHEFGHLLGLRHGGDDAVNCKPNYRSVMSYTRQFSGSPIVGRRLDYSRSEDPVLADPTKTGFLNEASLNELVGLGGAPSLGPVPGRNLGDAAFFPAADQIVFGPGSWSFATANAGFINWNRNKDKKGVPIQDAAAAANLNDGSGCTNLDPNEKLYGFDDWGNLLYRASAAIDFAGGRTSQKDITKEGVEVLFRGSDADSNGAGDGTDCGGAVHPDGTTSNPCTHRIDIRPSFPFPKTIDPGTEANMTVAIFSEKAAIGVPGSQDWNASTQVLLNDLVNHPLTFRVENWFVGVKLNNKGGGTCSISDVTDPITNLKDGVKDLKCQFASGPMPDGTTLPLGTHFGVVNGFFFDPITGENRAFTARQEVTIVE